MKNSLLSKVSLGVWLCLTAWTIAAQQSPTGPLAAASPNPVPKLINYSGLLRDVNGKALNGVTGVTFLLYTDEQGGAPVWLETQNVTPDKNGRYTVTLGATSSDGLPANVFANGEARWLGVQVEGQAEQPRVLLLSVPYALKAADAETLGGLPASAFVQAVPGGSVGNAGPSARDPSAATVGGKAETTGKRGADATSTNQANVTGSGTPKYIPLWMTSTDLGSSAIYESASHNIGIGTTSPTAPLTVTGASSLGASVIGDATSTSGTTAGVLGASASSSGTGVSGAVGATSGNTIGVVGASASSSGVGVFGDATAATGSAFGVDGTTASPSGSGVVGVATATNGEALGVFGESASPSGAGVLGQTTATSGFTVGVVGTSTSSSGAAFLAKPPPRAGTPAAWRE